MEMREYRKYKLGYQNASDPNTTVINSTVAVPMEMREYRKYKLEIANVLLGDAGGWAYFILSTYVANEYFMPIEQDHRTSDDVLLMDMSDEYGWDNPKLGYYPGDLGAYNQGYYGWGLRNEWYGRANRGLVLQVLPPRRGEWFQLVAPIFPTQWAHYLEIACIGRTPEESHVIGSDGPVLLNGEPFDGVVDPSGAMGGTVYWKPGSQHQLNVPMTRVNSTCAMSVKTFLFPKGNYADQGDFKPWPRQVSNTNDQQPRMLLSEPLPAGLYAFRIPPAEGRFRVSFFTNMVDANVTIIAAAGFTFEPDVCAELPRCECRMDDLNDPNDMLTKNIPPPEDPYEFARMIDYEEFGNLRTLARKNCACRKDREEPYKFPADNHCEIVPVPEIAGGPYENTEVFVPNIPGVKRPMQALRIWGPGTRKGTLRMRGPPVLPSKDLPTKPMLAPKYMAYNSRPPWYIITSDGQAEMWHEFPGLRVYALPCMLTVPAVPNLRRQLVTVEFTLQGALMDPRLSDAGDATELRGMRLILDAPIGYEFICELLKDFEEDGDCRIQESLPNQAVITLAERIVRAGDFALCILANMPSEQPPADANDFVLRVETMDGVGVAAGAMRAPQLVDYTIDRPKLKWLYFVAAGPMPVSVMVSAPARKIIRLISSLLITLPPNFVHRVFEPENIEAPNIPYDTYDLDVSDPRRIRLVLIKEAWLEGLLKVNFEVSVPEVIPLGSNIWKVSLLTDFEEELSFALPGFEIGDTPSDWVPASALGLSVAALALLGT